MDSIGSDLEPSHVEEELEEGEHWHNDVSVCIVMEELASQHTGEHERVYSYRHYLDNVHSYYHYLYSVHNYCHYLYIVHMLLSLPVHCKRATVTTCTLYTCYRHYLFMVYTRKPYITQCIHV